MNFIFEPEWESSKEDDDADFIYEEIVLPKIKEVGLESRWDRYEKMPIKAWMMANEDEMDFCRTLTQQPLERLKTVAVYVRRYRSKDI